MVMWLVKMVIHVLFASDSKLTNTLCIYYHVYVLLFLFFMFNMFVCFIQAKLLETGNLEFKR